MILFSCFIDNLFNCEVRIALMGGVLATIFCNNGCQWLPAGRWFLPGTPVFSTNKTGHHDITEVLLKVALSTKNQNQPNQTYIDPLFKLLIPQGSKLGKKRTCFWPCKCDSLYFNHFICFCISILFQYCHW